MSKQQKQEFNQDIYFRNRNVKVKYNLIVINDLTGQEDYLPLGLSESQVRSYLKKNEAKFKDSSIFGLPNVGISASEERVKVFKESVIKRSKPVPTKPSIATPKPYASKPISVKEHKAETIEKKKVVSLAKIADDEAKEKKLSL